MRRRSGTTGELLGLAAIGDGGLAIATDGTYLRYLEVLAPVNSLVADEQTNARVAEAFSGVLARLQAGQALQLYVQAQPLAVGELLAREAHAVAVAANTADAESEPGLGIAMRRLGVTVEHSLHTHSEAVAAMSLRYLIVVPWHPGGLPHAGRDGMVLKARTHERAIRDSLRHTDGIRRDLDAMRLTTRLLDGREIIDLLWSRFDPVAASTGTPAASFMRPDALELPVPGESLRDARARSVALCEAICTAPLDFSARTHLRAGSSLEHVSFLAGVPEHTWLGWLLHFMQAARPFTLSVHVHATDRLRERQAQKRRWKRLRGVNLGVERRGAPVDPEAVEREREAQDVTRDLAVSAGAGVYRMSVYLHLREPGPEPDPLVLAEHAQTVGREVTLVSDARLDRGTFVQRALWESSLPLARDRARRTRKYLTLNVADSLPLVGTGCGSPAGIPLGYAQPGRTLERLDPFDREHENHMLIVNGKAGTGKTMTVNILLIRALCKGLRGAIIDRAGHFQFLSSLVPGAIQLQLGGRENRHAVCPWDVPDPGRVEQSKVDYLLALHALLLARHDSDGGLGDLEENLLGLAIREVYTRCALTGEQPRELLLQEELFRRETSEAQAGASDIAATLRNLALRLNNYVADGPYAYLTDWPTTVAAGSPLVIFDTRAIPDSRAPAALFVICEHTTTKIERERNTYLAGHGPAHEWAGRSVLVVDEAWKLIESRATGRWFNELSRRSRHLALWLIGISQQLSDFDNEHGRALLANASMRLFLRQDAKELQYMRETLGLSSEQVEAISSLQTSKREYATAFLMNGTRGSGTISIRVSDLEYWIATSDPVGDEPVRRRALRDTGGDAWEALRLLATPEWHQQQATRREAV
jgi:TraG P-loop domain